MPWRVPDPGGVFNPYKILVSEFMLQQTQVSRVIPKYEQFLRLFPTLNSLAEASFADVVAAWSGLGYNRRAKYLYEAAGALRTATEPWTVELLVAQKGIGPNTAAAVVAYSYDQPVIFLETNIMTVLIYHFFQGREAIPDKHLLEKLDQVVPWNTGVAISPREFYWSLMDYGAYLKATVGNHSRFSDTFTKQARFQGSGRQLRGQIIRLLVGGPRPLKEIVAVVSDERLPDIIAALEREQMVRVQGNTLMLYNKDK